MHGAQDGQKFMSIFILAVALAAGMGTEGTMVLPVWLMVFCALNMGVGTAVGGERIIKSVGVNMVKLESFQGLRRVSRRVSLALATFGGLPSRRRTPTRRPSWVWEPPTTPKGVKWSIAIDMVKTWVLTFPGCGLMGATPAPSSSCSSYSHVQSTS